MNNIINALSNTHKLAQEKEGVAGRRRAANGRGEERGRGGGETVKVFAAVR